MPVMGLKVRSGPFTSNLDLIVRSKVSVLLPIAFAFFKIDLLRPPADGSTWKVQASLWGSKTLAMRIAVNRFVAAIKP
jgi:hypothetical protein